MKTSFPKAAKKTYEKYLAYNGVDDGMKSYGRMLDLMLAYKKIQ